MKTLKVLTFNIHKGLNISSSKLVLAEIKTLLEQSQADIVFLQEVQGEHDKRRDKFTDWPEQTHTEYLAENSWPYFFYGQNHTHSHGHHGNAILSKFPLVAMDNVDISASRFSNRGLLYTRIEVFNKPLHLICTHLGLLKKERQQQFAALNEFIEKHIEPEHAILMAGDFNDWRSRSADLLDESIGLKEIFQELQGSHAKSFPAELPLLKVDRIYFRGLIPTHCDTVSTKKISDHRPLIAEFQWETHSE
jgi:endonuclease/exonuclease/phosphatase family metal-dependent hydrolase